MARQDLQVRGRFHEDTYNKDDILDTITQWNEDRGREVNLTEGGYDRPGTPDWVNSRSADVVRVRHPVREALKSEYAVMMEDLPGSIRDVMEDGLDSLGDVVSRDRSFEAPYSESVYTVEEGERGGPPTPYKGKAVTVIGSLTPAQVSSGEDIALERTVAKELQPHAKKNQDSNESGRLGSLITGREEIIS